MTKFRKGMWIRYTDSDDVEQTGILVKQITKDADGAPTGERWDVHLTNAVGETKAVVQGVDYQKTCKQAAIDDIPAPRRNVERLEKLGYQYK